MPNKSIQDYFADREASLKARIQYGKPLLLRLLKEAGVAEVTVAYDGEGDSGQITEVAGIDVFGTEIDLTEASRIDLRVGDKLLTHNSLAEYIEDYCWDLLGLYHDGFEIHDGGFGEFTINVETGSIILGRNDRYTDFNSSVVEV